jgi:hypothetical protein
MKSLHSVGGEAGDYASAKKRTGCNSRFLFGTPPGAAVNEVPKKYSEWASKEFLFGVFFSRVGFLRFFHDLKISVVVAQTLFKTGVDASAGFATSSQGKCFTANIASNDHFCSLIFRHKTSPPRP